jgi:hypothetical protein
VDRSIALYRFFRCAGMEARADLFTKSAVYATFLISYRIEETFLIIYRHPDALLRTNGQAGTASATLLFIGKDNHFFSFLRII